MQAVRLYQQEAAFYIQSEGTGSSFVTGRKSPLPRLRFSGHIRKSGKPERPESLSAAPKAEYVRRPLYLGILKGTGLAGEEAETEKKGRVGSGRECRRKAERNRKRMLYISREYVQDSLDKSVAPAAVCDSGETVVFQTRDCYDDSVTCGGKAPGRPQGCAGKSGHRPFVYPWRPAGDIPEGGNP